MNRYDSGRIAQMLLDAGWEQADSPDSAELLLLNTCSVREHAEERVWGKLYQYRSLKRAKPGLTIGVLGCMAEILREEIISRFPEVGLVLGPGHFASLPEGVEKARFQPVFATGFPDGGGDFFPPGKSASGPVCRSVTVMRGCDNFCSYCVVPYTRGRERSRPAADILEEIAGLVRGGCREVTLLGQNVNSYRGKRERGGEIGFPELLELVHGLPGLSRIRFVTSHPKDITAALIDSVGRLPKVCEELHFPAQSGSDRVLKLMNRGYTRLDYLERTARLRAAVPGIALKSDFIVGFPGETEADFRQTLELIEEIGFDGIFVFAYSPRPLTGASRWKDDVPEEEKLRRLAVLLQLQQRISLRRHRALIGKTVEVLAERRNPRRPERAEGAAVPGRRPSSPGKKASPAGPFPSGSSGSPP